MVVSPRNQTNVPDNVVILDDDEDASVSVPVPEPAVARLAHAVQKQPVTGNTSAAGGGGAMNQQIYLWHQIAAHMRRERMLAEHIRAAAGGDAPPVVTSSYYNNIDPMIQFQAEVLQKQYLMYAHFYHNRSNIMDNNRTSSNRPVLGVNPASRVIRKPSSGGAAAGRLQYGYLHGGGAMARPDQPLVAGTTAARVLSPGRTGLGLGLGVGVGGGDSEPEGIDLTLKL